MKFKGYDQRTAGKLHGGFADVVVPSCATNAVLLAFECIRKGVVTGYKAACIAFFDFDDDFGAVGREADDFEPGSIADAESACGAGFEIFAGGEVGLGAVCSAFNDVLRKGGGGHAGKDECDNCFHAGRFR